LRKMWIAHNLNQIYRNPDKYQSSQRGRRASLSYKKIIPGVHQLFIKIVVLCAFLKA
jgi:hypothetical protein